MNNIKQYVQENKERFLQELIDLLKIPSVSADSAYSQDVIDTADAVKLSRKQVAKLLKFVIRQVIQLFMNILSTEFTNRFSLWSLRCTTTRSNRIMDIATI
jgi:acetylornithine deacetylase/succinyl-diaminopimelate desuccinylase-like protein